MRKLCEVRVVTRPNTITKRKGRLSNFSDYTATTILGKFQNDAAGRSVERVLEKLSKKKTAEILAVSSYTASLGYHIFLPI
jgi:import receptor subunit TOM70